MSRYERLQPIATGGMGVVHLCRAQGGPAHGKLVALKRLHSHLEQDPAFSAMFFEEARFTAGLHHPNVVEIVEFGADDEGRFLALEFVPGEPLSGIMTAARDRGIPLPVGLALYIVARTAEGLHAAHDARNERGELLHLVHRDVSPSNILVGIHGEVKLIDFGVARARDRQQHTTGGTLKGKFGYMSPEQARGQAIDRRSDVFALGVVLWELLALRRMYRTDSEFEVLRMIAEEPHTPVRAVRAEVPASVEQILDAALAKNRDDRLGSCGEFAEFLWSVYSRNGYSEGPRELAAFMERVAPDKVARIRGLISQQWSNSAPGAPQTLRAGSAASAPVLPSIPKPSPLPRAPVQLPDEDQVTAPRPTAAQLLAPAPVENPRLAPPAALPVSQRSNTLFGVAPDALAAARAQIAAGTAASALPLPAKPSTGTPLAVAPPAASHARTMIGAVPPIAAVPAPPVPAAVATPPPAPVAAMPVSPTVTPAMPYAPPPAVASASLAPDAFVGPRNPAPAGADAGWSLGAVPGTASADPGFRDGGAARTRLAGSSEAAMGLAVGPPASTDSERPSWSDGPDDDSADDDEGGIERDETLVDPNVFESESPPAVPTRGLPGWVIVGGLVLLGALAGLVIVKIVRSKGSASPDPVAAVADPADASAPAPTTVPVPSTAVPAAPVEPLVPQPAVAPPPPPTPNQAFPPANPALANHGPRPASRGTARTGTRTAPSTTPRGGITLEQTRRAMLVDE